jgi:hypothetical protein
MRYLVVEAAQAAVRYDPTSIPAPRQASGKGGLPKWRLPANWQLAFTGSGVRKASQPITNKLRVRFAASRYSRDNLSLSYASLILAVRRVA